MVPTVKEVLLAIITGVLLTVGAPVMPAVIKVAEEL